MTMTSYAVEVKTCSHVGWVTLARFLSPMSAEEWAMQTEAIKSAFGGIASYRVRFTPRRTDNCRYLIRASAGAPRCWGSDGYTARP
jgi:hypothetical protein